MGLSYLEAGESACGHLFHEMMPPESWQMDMVGGLHTSWLVNVLYTITGLMLEAGLHPDQAVHVTFSEGFEQWPGGDWQPVIRYQAMALGQVKSRGGPALPLESPEQVAAIIAADRITYGCTCPDERIPFRLVPTEIPDRYQVQQIHHPACPAPERMKARPNIGAN